MGTRDFDKEIAADSPDRDDPVWFKLFGRRWDCRDYVNGKLLMDRAAEMESDSVEQQRDGVVGVFQMTVVDEQIESLLDNMDDPDKVIQLSKLVEIVGWLVEQYSENPTEPPAPSPRGRTNRGRTSTAKPSARGSGSSRSTLATT